MPSRVPAPRARRRLWRRHRAGQSGRQSHRQGRCAPSASICSLSPVSRCPPSSCGGMSGRAIPRRRLTCGCGDPAQEVWFMAWPAWAITHLHSVFFSGVVNVPHGANLLSNTSGPLVGVVLAPVTWLFGPVTATNVALTLAPALSAWACFAAIRPLVNWKAGRHPGGAGVRLLGGPGHLAHLRPRVGHRARDPTVPLHHAARDRDPPGALGRSRRSAAGRPVGGAVLHFARDPGDVPASRCRRAGRGHGWSAGASCGRVPGTPSRLSASAPP